jgi:acyl carrier protein
LSASPPTSSDEILGREEIERSVTATISAAFAVGTRDIADSSFVLSGSRFFSSFALLELIVRLEEAFGIEIPDADLDQARFDSLRSISDYVQRRLGPNRTK